MAFTKPVRQEIYKRAESKSELSGVENRPLVCAHLNHRGNKKRRKREKINCPNNGILVTDIEHYAHHRLFIEQSEAIGLFTEENNLTIERFHDYFFNRGDFEDPDFDRQVQEAEMNWREMYSGCQSKSARTTNLSSAVQRG